MREWSLRSRSLLRVKLERDWLLKSFGDMLEVSMEI